MVFSLCRRVIKKVLSTLFLGVSLLLLSFSEIYAETTEDVAKLFSLSLEQLMNIEVSVSDRDATPLRDTPAAITVLTSQDIKLSGMRSIPELLRLVPGVNVRKIDSNKWAVNSRRSPERLADSMLILMDGRTLYNPLFAGTYWDLQDTILEDIDRIEVVRGPGSSAWGANAITGVVNIVTKSSSETQGTQIVGGGGSGDMRHELSARHGDGDDQATFRIYGKLRQTEEGHYLLHPESNNPGFFPNEQGASDGIRSEYLGFRVDTDDSNRINHAFSGNAYRSESKEVRVLNNGASFASNTIKTDGYYFLYRNNIELDPDSAVEMNAYYDFSDRNSDIFQEQTKIYHVEGISHQSFDRHRVSAGAYVRRVDDDTTTLNIFTLNPASRTNDLYSVFLQDRWQSLSKEWVVIGGVRFEHNDDTDWEYNPTLRSVYRFSEDTQLWGGITRSVRTPSRINSDGELDFGFFTVPVRSENLKSVVTKSIELGIRRRYLEYHSVEISGFFDRENDPLVDSDGSSLRKSKYMGVEVEYSFRPKKAWQLVGSTSYLDSRKGSIDGSSSVNNTLWASKIRATYTLSESLTLSTLLMYDKGLETDVPNDDFADIVRLDGNLYWQVNAGMSVQFSVKNLLDEYHLEASDPTKVNTAVERGGDVTFRLDL